MITPNDYLRSAMFAATKTKRELNEMQITGYLVLKLLDGYKDEVLKNMESSSRIVQSCEHENTYQESVKCTLCDDCGDIVETDV